jgi:biopolymer transport protein TolR
MMSVSKKNRFQRRPMAEINIVPYVDVMLVLLVIFMITVPVLTQGVHIELPQATSEPLAHDEKPPLVVSVNELGALFLDSDKTPLEPTELAIKVRAALQVDPKRSVLVKGDKHVEYGRVMGAMVLLKQAGVTKVGLMTQHYETKS